LLFAAPSAHAAFPGQNGKIAYLCGVGICTINSDGTQNTRFTQIAPASDPAWSPDGTKIAFAGNSDNNAEIYVMQADGTAPTPLTINQLDDEDPAWSPDGTKIVFTSNRDDPNPSGCAPSCNLNLYVMNADGSQPTRLTSGGFVESDPSWAPGGARIAFHCGGASGSIHNICLVNPDGTGLVNLGAGEHPNWLPDGSKIAFDSVGQNSSGIVFTMNPDGTGRTMLTPDTTGLFLGEPAWSPDGTKFADAGRGCFTPSGCPPWRGVETRNADGTPLMGLTSEPEDDHQPDWQPTPTRPNRPPGCAGIAASRPVLTTANHRLIPITLDGATDPDGDPVTLAVDGVTQDEPVVGSGDNTSPDAVDQGDGQLRVRAERNPHGDGRVYRIAFTASDGHGGSCSGTATVSVPRKKRKAAIDSAPPSYDSLVR
jgi:TolB protein